MIRGKVQQNAQIYTKFYKIAKALKTQILGRLSTYTIKEVLQKMPLSKRILVRGWVQAIRKHKDVYFVDLVDRTCFDKLQIIIEAKGNSHPTYGSSIKVEGCLLKSLHKGQDVELMADNWNTLGVCPENYPFLYHQKYSPEYIRQHVHLRPRTRKFSSVLRIRSHASIAVHNFFQDEGFCFVHTPIITKNDCEGAGEVFSIELKEKASHVKATATKVVKKDIPAMDEKALNLNDLNDPKLNILKDELNNSNGFFNGPTYLTVSGQLHLEAMACALTHVYNFGPVFRAESSQTRQHASEFLMIEAELAFTETVEDLLKMVEKCIKSVTNSVVVNCSQEVNYLCESIEGHEEYLKKIVEDSFVQMSYDEAITILQNNKEFLHVPIEWGKDFVAEHKQFLLKYCHNTPVFICMFPSSLKPFYMKSNENKMACCFDLFAPFGGEICGGSLRENNEQIIKAHSFWEKSGLSWYLDLRRFGTVPHGGFGIGFDRLLQSILGIPNIRDVIPFPRRKYDCKC